MEKEIVIVGNYHILRKGLGSLFENDTRFKVVGEASGPSEFFLLLEQVSPDLILLDLVLPQKDVISILKYHKKYFSQIPVMVLAIGASEGAVLDAVMLGVKGVIWRDDRWDDLIRAMELVVAGEVYFDLPESRSGENLTEHLKEAAAVTYDLKELSSRELEVLKLIAEGFSYKEIASELSISPRTVESHKNNLLEKLNLNSQIDLVKFAMRLGIVK